MLLLHFHVHPECVQLLLHLLSVLEIEFSCLPLLVEDLLWKNSRLLGPGLHPTAFYRVETRLFSPRHSGFWLWVDRHVCCFFSINLKLLFHRNWRLNQCSVYFSLHFKSPKRIDISQLAFWLQTFQWLFTGYHIYREESENEFKLPLFLWLSGILYMHPANTWLLSICCKI